MSGAAHTAGDCLLSILDCPDCRAEGGLVPQARGGAQYLACPRCEFWYPIEDEVPVLLVPARNPHGLRAPLEPVVPFPLQRRPARSVDFKALVYSYYARLHEFGSAFAVDREPVVVDIGCSTGSLACWLRPEQIYLGFDLSLPSLRFARKASGQFFVQADAERLPIKTGSVPFFTSREMLEHLGDPLAGASELRRIGQRGVIVVPTLDFPALYDPINWLLIRRGRRAKFGIFGYGHQELHDIAGWRSLLERGGLTIEGERPIGTGLWLNAFDVVWHSLYSWRDFDDLPRRGAPLGLARASFALRRTQHRIDRPLLPRRGASQAFAVTGGGQGRPA
jgi:uncharacterized protein YbaR (Trm112 family)